MSVRKWLLPAWLGKESPQSPVLCFAEPCPACGREVLFAPGQKRNRCGWCGAQVVRLGLE